MRVIRRTLGLPLEFLGFEHLPAIGRVPITNPTALRSLAKLNRGKKYHNRIKPFDLLLSCHVKPFGYPPDVDPEKFHLVAPYVPDPECWVDLPWIDQYSGKQYEITTEGFHGSRGVARVKTYGAVLREYVFHPGATSADVKGKAQRQANGWAAAPTTRTGRTNHLHRQRIEPTGRNRSGNNSFTRGRFYRISRPAPWRVADENSADLAEDPDSNLKEIQWEIPFDAAANDYWAESATKKESGAA
jgi:hypothetical protein